MQDRPDATTLLQGVARFLTRDLLPALDDQGLAFRVRIAAWLCGMVALEHDHGATQDAVERERLVALLGPGAEGLDTPELNERLARRLRDDAPLDPAAWEAIRAHVHRTLVERLAIVQPRFDTRPDIEGP